MNKQLYKETGKFSQFLGKALIWYNRLATYMGMTNFSMIFFLFVIESPLGIPWFGWIAILSTGLISILFIDIKFLMHNSIRYQFQKNPEVQEIKQVVYENREMIKQLLEEYNER